MPRRASGGVSVHRNGLLNRRVHRAEILQTTGRRCRFCVRWLMEALQWQFLRGFVLAPLTVNREAPERKPFLSRWRELPPVPDWTGDGRTQSVLADALSPVIHRRRFRQYKTLPPRVSLGRRICPSRLGHDKPRIMTEQEREWHASPYLRMLSTPLRNCVLTAQPLPKDFLVRLAPVKVTDSAGSQSKQYLIPSGLEHPRFRSRRATRGIYVVCRQDAIDRLARQPAGYKRIGRYIGLHSSLKKQVSHLLRLRVIQEVEMLADRVRCRPKNAGGQPLLRRLTRAELKSIRDTGIIPYPSAVAVLIVPPLNKDSATGERQMPNHTSFPDPPEMCQISNKPLPPLSQLLCVSSGALEDFPADIPFKLPPPKVPLYNGIPLFPSRPQRAAFHLALNNLLAIERKARYRQEGRPEVHDTGSSSTDKWARRDQKASHAYLLSSDAGTMLRADTVPLAIALWRVRMWEGDMWEGAGQAFKGWRLDTLTE
ncbi:hypothetical protein BXZ70DRAFT_904143 [Cristinia sonorae]|uniref:Uncharacterized protein n=1 Tax=Cristinia sonorae TaxID=1940300 RepID=A0A8K0UX64_9AGAR|nr:hypothetical protein BXZ70DRAFT_904143 [Cristinia sonorae]